jgi:KaiC/GvpD/RAD55 family RecA-like ATPase
MIVPRAPSGIPGLDSLIEGGIPLNSTIALRAEPSNPVEYFQQQFVMEGVKQGLPAVYCCLSRSAASVIKAIKHQGFEVLEAIANDQLILLDCYSMSKRTSTIGVDAPIQKKIITVTDIDDERLLQDGLASAVERISNLKGLRAVCESVPGSLTTKSGNEIMRWGRRAFSDLRAFDTIAVHTFPINVREDLFNTMALDFDCILELRVDKTTDRLRHLLAIQKMHLTEIPQKTLELDMERGFLSVKTTQKIV